jgi:hypothetical protein
MPGADLSLRRSLPRTQRFPRRIVYRRDSAALIARIEGTVNGQPRAREWVFRRLAP